MFPPVDEVQAEHMRAVAALAGRPSVHVYDGRVEHRAFLEVRAEGRLLVGIAAPFGVETRIGGTIESIAPGAFSRTLADGHDVLALVDHDQGKLLGRTRSGSLRLRETRQGLEFEVDCPDTGLGHDVLALATRGDLGGMSFAFKVRPPDGERWSGRRRELRDLDLVEVSVVHAWPAYQHTTVQARRFAPRLNAASRWLATVCGGLG
jgi:HK97 family phage prohead protease